MEMVIKTGSAKQLDEVCNYRNDAYGDEVLYATWVNASHSDDESRTGAAGERDDLSAFLAGLGAVRH